MNLQVFENNEFGTIRTVEVNNEIMFVGKDIATALGYKNFRDAIIRHVDIEDKMDGVVIHDSIGRLQNVVAINESGMYSLILSSKLPKAKEFKHWVTSEVLPSIRKHGMYAAEELLNNPEFAMQVFNALREERNKSAELEKENAKQIVQIAEMQPKVEFCDNVLDSDDLLPITIIAKDYGWSGTRMNKYLNDNGIQYKQHGTWILNQKYADKGYTKTKTRIYNTFNNGTHTTVQTYWTQKGRMFIYELLKADGILPNGDKE